MTTTTMRTAAAMTTMMTMTTMAMGAAAAGTRCGAGELGLTANFPGLAGGWPTVPNADVGQPPALLSLVEFPEREPFDPVMTMLVRRLLSTCLLSALLLGACGPAAPTPQPTASAPPAATATPAEALASDTAAPSEASAAPAATTPAPPTAAAPTETPQPSAEPTAAPAARNPLTGLAVDDAAVLDRRPLAIKVAHFPRRVRDAQVGLSQADHIWEHYAEGGTVRFTAIFLSQGPERIGNVRSARLIDIHLAHAYQALLVASGSSTGTMNRLRDAGLFERVIAEATGYRGCPVLCREEADTPTTDNLYTSAPALWELSDELNLGELAPLGGFAFSEETPAGGVPAETIHLDFQVNNTVTEWRYDAAQGRYDRWIDTAAMPELAQHVDTANGQPLTAANVVVLYASYLPSNIWEEEGGVRHYSYDVVLEGGGPGRVFRDGQMLEITWEREAFDSGLPRLVGADGDEVALKPGVTWFEVLDPDSPTRFEEGLFYARSKVPDASAAPTATP
jgi:hypothetical protein